MSASKMLLSWCGIEGSHNTTLGDFRVWRDVKLLMMFGDTIRTRRGTLVPTHSSSTCFMRTDTLQASLVTSLLSGKAACAEQDISSNTAKGQRRQRPRARLEVLAAQQKMSFDVTREVKKQRNY